MSPWNEGYIADIPYSLGFYRETLPAHIAFAAMSVGKHPGLCLKPERVLELGIGMGLGFTINAASNPTTHFEGVDFNPLHIAHARSLIEAAALGNVSLREASFQDVAEEAREGQHDLDLIVLHGILTWVSQEAQRAIVEIARKRLRSGGLLYVSYNAMPGWAPVLPMQRLMRENAKRMAGRSDVQTASGLELVKALMGEGAAYFIANPGLAPRIERLLAMDRNYLAHEYLNENWFIFHFAEVAELFGGAKLGYVGSATLTENMDALCVPDGVRGRVAAEADIIFKETLRDVASNKQFRRDVFARGVTLCTAAEQITLLSAQRFALVVSRNKVSYKFQGPLGEVTGNPELYGAIADRLSGGIATFSEIAALPSLAKSGLGGTLQAISLFVHSGQVLPLPASEGADFDAANRLNRVIVDRMLQGRTYNFLAAPLCGSGIPVSHGDLLMLSAVYADEGGNAESMTNCVIATMQRLGVNWVKNGQAVTTPSETVLIVRAEAEEFLVEKLPSWQRLGVL
ncbi:class I SAM-dependent methyltransferase [Methylobacterium sp. WL120]|uniref:class I SAM-dependent methyltransferase n=1 Tax=Methylobacterium sp. WL120 TaxID=2603887 RepID=UPI0011C7F14A|nr:class I SAM-dependent methyltransferase [Methylobacterium sp. WL120]TXM65489.1 methyltransferase domain-containing protein [Methylobacterium sp. WL120]